MQKQKKHIYIYIYIHIGDLVVVKDKQLYINKKNSKTHNKNERKINSLRFLFSQLFALI